MTETIIIIEDDPDILDLMTFILQDEGFNVIPSTNSDILKNIYDNKPHLILLDNRLADGQGSILCKNLKQDPETSSIPIILISANNNLEQMAIDSQADQYLNKPFDIKELIAVVNKFIPAK